MAEKIKLDAEGSVVAAARMNPANGYNPIPALLKQYIDEGSESAWVEIKRRVDNVYAAAAGALDSLENETRFSRRMQGDLAKGRKLFFKPNHVVLPVIDYQTHGLGLPGVSTPWEFAAAVMRWFHDKQGVSYHQMCVGEAGTSNDQGALLASEISGQTITSCAIFEGKYGNFCGGWGFYFARKYLKECHDKTHSDDPMSGYEESLNGSVLPSGKAVNKLLIYDLNKVTAATSRDVPVERGINYKSITLHKALVGGNPSDPQDIKDWPGCVLVNLPKLKVHLNELFTGAVKNIGIGIYPMEANASKKAGEFLWKYAIPDVKTPGLKMKLPHSVYRLQLDGDTLLPIRDKKGNYAQQKTGGLEATISDANKAIQGQNIFVIHVVDAIEITNLHHCAPACQPTNEGFVFAGLDPVAVDECAGRYMFRNIPHEEAQKIQNQLNLSTDVIQKVPVPKIEGKNIITGEGYDTTFSRYNLFKHCEERGLGKRQFHLVGEDLWHGGKLASSGQSIGRIVDGEFREMVTSTMYHVVPNALYSLQATIFAYVAANDRLTNSGDMAHLLDLYDENKDGVIDYMEKGQFTPPPNPVDAWFIDLDIKPDKALKMRFLMAAGQYKLFDKEWNTMGCNFAEPAKLKQALAKALVMSQAAVEHVDPLYPGRVWGKGKWPSLQYAFQGVIFGMIYGPAAPGNFDIKSIYGLAMRYADMCEGTDYCGKEALAKNENVIGNYHKAVAQGKKPLPFTLYVPQGFGTNGGAKIPNVQETKDAGLIFTAEFGNGENWRQLHLSEFNLKWTNA